MTTSHPPQAILPTHTGAEAGAWRAQIEERSSSSAPFVNIAVQNEVSPLDNQGRRSNGLARLEIAMRLCSLFQRIGLIDLDLDRLTARRLRAPSPSRADQGAGRHEILACVNDRIVAAVRLGGLCASREADRKSSAVFPVASSPRPRQGVFAIKTHARAGEAGDALIFAPRSPALKQVRCLLTTSF